MDWQNPFRLLGNATALAPLKERTFRMLWLAWLAANMTMWMNDVAAAWRGSGRPSVSPGG